MAPTTPPDERVSAADAVRRFLDVLNVEKVGDDVFRAWNPPQPGRGRLPLFGGQVAAHALGAAASTVDAPHVLHSLHGYFLRPGKDDATTTLRVQRLRDGESFTTRSVVALQDDEAILSLTSSFHKDEPGEEFATGPAADIPSPAELLAHVSPSTWPWGEDSPFERLEVPEFSHARMSDQPRRAMWIRLKSRIEDDPHLHACVLTYVSDMGVLGAVRAAVGGRREWGMTASLDHAVWFHRRARADEWLLFDVSARTNAGSRGLGIGTMHTADGVHATTVSQEGVIRLPS
jgi:acyl-CoA thioesterase II